MLVELDAVRSGDDDPGNLLDAGTIAFNVVESRRAVFRYDANAISVRATDYSGRISKKGDSSVRAVLYEAGHLILTRPPKRCTALKSWAMRIAKRAGTKKAAVALARKLAVIMHRMLADGMSFRVAA